MQGRRMPDGKKEDLTDTEMMDKKMHHVTREKTISLLSQMV